MKTVAAFALLLLAAAAHAQIKGESGAIYIAGDRFSLEQAIADATLENVGPDGSSPFVVVATGSESRKLTVKGTKRNIRDAVRRMQRAGGAFYVCERDVKQAGLSKKDLLPGVQIERGWNNEELTQPAGSGSVSPALRRIRRLC